MSPCNLITNKNGPLLIQLQPFFFSVLEIVSIILQGFSWSKADLITASMGTIFFPDFVSIILKGLLIESGDYCQIKHQACLKTDVQMSFRYAFGLCPFCFQSIDSDVV